MTNSIENNLYDRKHETIYMYIYYTDRLKNSFKSHREHLIPMEQSHVLDI